MTGLSREVFVLFDTCAYVQVKFVPHLTFMLFVVVEVQSLMLIFFLQTIIIYKIYIALYIICKQIALRCFTNILKIYSHSSVVVDLRDMSFVIIDKQSITMARVYLVFILCKQSESVYNLLYAGVW